VSVSAEPVGTSRPLRYLLGALALAISAVMLAPLVLAFLGSLTPPFINITEPSYLPIQPGLENYLYLWQAGAGLPRYLFNSIAVALMAVGICLALSIPAGYGLARFPVPRKEVWFLLLLLPIMIPYQVLIVPLYLTFARLGLTNSLLGLAIVHATFQVPFSVYIMRQAFEDVPRQLEEAAQLDGSSSFGTLLRIFMPLTLPGIITVALFAFIASWNEYLAALIFMNRETSFTLPVNLLNISVGPATSSLAGIVVAILPCMAIYILLRKYFGSVAIT
jgi:multiple sugar transport system permease protein